MDWANVHSLLVFFQHCVSVIGILIILAGVIYALGRYLYDMAYGNFVNQGEIINDIRLSLGRRLILGLEFIVAADLIGSTTTPDYYSVGLLAIIVLIRTFLSFSLNKEMMSLSNKNET